MSKTKTTASVCSPHELQMASCPKPRYSGISRHSSIKGTHFDIGEWLTSFRRDFPVRRFPSLESNPPPTTPGICGLPPSRLFAWFDRSSRSWKTSQGSLLALMGTLEPSSVTWPKSGTMCAGVCSVLPTLGPRTSESGSGYFATPTATANQLSPSMMKHPGCQLIMAKRYLWPTPRAYSFDKSHTPGLTSLDIRVRGLYMDNPRYWPTPNARDYKDRGRSTDYEKIAKKHKLAGVVGGALNPTWIEWLMGWPMGFTSLEPLDTMAMEVWKYASTQKRPRNQAVRNLWWSDDPATLGERKTGLDVQETALLLRKMLRQHADGERPEAQYWQTEGPEDVCGAEVQSVPSDNGTTQAPHRPGHSEQRTDEHRNSVPVVPQQRAREAATPAEGVPVLPRNIPTTEGKNATLWKEIMQIGMGAPVGRVAVGVSDRVSRLKALGNGQVPIVAATAWRILTEGLT